jgi:hypothetical protein
MIAAMYFVAETIEWLAHAVRKQDFGAHRNSEVACRLVAALQLVEPSSPHRPATEYIALQRRDWSV